MKKFIKLTFIGAVMAVAFSGCLKDKGFDNGEYGVDVNERKALSFPQAISGSVLFSVFSSNDPVVISAPVIAIEAINAQSSDVNFTVGLKPDLVAADPSLTLLPASEYTLNLNGKVEAGKLLDTLQIVLPTSANLDPNLVYGLGLELLTADNGFQVAGNMKEVLVKITVKNKYDGVYEVTGTYSDVAIGPNATGRYPFEYHLITKGPSSVDVGLDINGEIAPGYLFNNAGNGFFYGSFGIQAFFDASDNIVEIRNYYGDPANAATGVGNPALGTGAPDYAASNGRRATIDPSGINTWDNSTGTPVVRVKYFMLQPSVVPGGPRCYFDETWTYLRPRD